jgi:hypothetical protein
MRTLALLCGFVVAAPLCLSAQPPSGTASSKIGWDQTGVASAADAQALTYRYYPDGAAVGIVLTGVTCSGTTTVTCQAPFPAFTPGTHTLTLTAGNIAGESAKSAPFAFQFVVIPAAPGNLRIL